MKSYLLLFSLVSCFDKPDYIAFGMEVYLNGTDKPTKEEFVSTTGKYLEEFEKETGIDNKIVKNYLIEFCPKAFSCKASPTGKCAGLWIPGSITIGMTKSCLAQTAWAHELGHAYVIRFTGKRDSTHSNNDWWEMVGEIKRSVACD